MIRTGFSGGRWDDAAGAELVTPGRWRRPGTETDSGQGARTGIPD
jgi:hypothetical protein